MVNYSDGKIYKIYNNKDDEIYIGSTCCSLSTRMSKHRYRAKEDRSKVHRLYVKMNALGLENFFIQLIEECPCENVEQLRKREGEIIKQLKSVLNYEVAGRTNEEYQKDNEAKLKEYRKDYYIKNQEEKKQKAKEYNEKNPEKKKEMDRQYYLKNSYKVICECGTECKKFHLSAHRKTQKHIDLMNKQHS